MRRVWVRGHENVRKRVLIQAAACNIGLLLRRLTGVGTPRSLQGRAVSVIFRLIERSVDRWGASDARLGVQMDTDGARRLNRSSPSCLNSGAQRTDFFHGLLTLSGSHHDTSLMNVVSVSVSMMMMMRCGSVGISRPRRRSGRQRSPARFPTLCGAPHSVGYAELGTMRSRLRHFLLLGYPLNRSPVRRARSRTGTRWREGLPGG